MQENNLIITIIKKLNNVEFAFGKTIVLFTKNTSNKDRSH